MVNILIEKVALNMGLNTLFIMWSSLFSKDGCYPAFAKAELLSRL
ncbi:hypothetical protein [Nonlabens dokdonensis]|uniref:Uncharacterized protein n=1 Tax=Nonlabens dokdonensis (strain DSM 17205 / KCTC 12402 / DSW-6) TaxID=592029 RepID=L7WBK9_NONDD|nr:hypothetical protein [Nonlabens dokdonensis]AGC77494.1 hypothetical protein DDD_2366 [Nonlabens dokdonensis DSW-6]